MNLAAVAAVVSAVAACIAATAALWGLRYAKGLIDTAVSDRQVDRVLALYESFTSGEVGAARTRFVSLMYRAGEAAFAPRTCWRPTWESLIAPDQGPTKESARARFLGVYPEDMVHAQGHRPIDDIRQVLWCFDRINEARKREASLDEGLLVSLMGHPATWWSLLCRRLETREGAHLYSLMQLAEWMEEEGWRNDPRNQHRKVPEDDFPGGEDEAPIPAISSPGHGEVHLHHVAGRDHGGHNRGHHLLNRRADRLDAQLPSAVFPARARSSRLDRRAGFCCASVSMGVPANDRSAEAR
jgi:hypothetical protein